MEQKILAFMKENGIAVFAEADRTTAVSYTHLTLPTNCT